MPRTVQFSVPNGEAEGLVDDLRDIRPIGLQLFRGASVQPMGDVVAVEISNAQLGKVMRIADRHGLGDQDGVTMSTSVPLSIVGSDYVALTREPGNATWEELQLTMGQESTMTADKVVVMAIAGLIAGVGIVSGAVHVVIGAMVIAPGFQPFARTVLGVLNRSATWRGGATDVLRGYGALVGGAAAAGVLSIVFGADALDAGGAGTYLPAAALIDYWTSVTWAGVVVGAVAGIAGGLLMAINRTVLTAGVMVALALVPTAAMVPIALIGGDVGLAGRAGLRFLIEAVLVVAASAAVFAVKRSRDERAETGHVSSDGQAVQ